MHNHARIARSTRSDAWRGALFRPDAAFLDDLAPARLLSGGERVWLNEALTRAIALYLGWRAFQGVEWLLRQL